MTQREICAKATAAKNQMLKRTFWQRFWAKVDKRRPDDCWPWLGSVNGDGYGQFKREGKALMAHRLSFEYKFGPIPAGMQICHHCDNPPCCNWIHLFLGTARDNVNDSIQKNRRRYRHGQVPKRQGENNGRSKLTEEVVRQVRELDLSSFGAKARLARSLGISATVLRYVLTRETWKHVK